MDAHALFLRVAVVVATQAITLGIVGWLQKPRPQSVWTRRLEYGKRAKAFSIAVSVSLPVCVVIVGAIASPRMAGAIAGWLGGFLATVAMTTFLLVRTHTVTTFDGEGLCVLSPLRKARVLRWGDVRMIRWRARGLLALSDGARNVVHIAPGLPGTLAVASECMSRVPSEIVGRDPEARAALDLMSAGLAHALVVSRARPSIIRAALRR